MNGNQYLVDSSRNKDVREREREREIKDYWKNINLSKSDISSRSTVKYKRWRGLDGIGS